MNDFYEKLLSKWDWWMVLGIAAQALFSARFVLQWLASEKHRKSVMPISFWYLSIFGSLGVLVYAIHRADPVFILAYAFNSLIYARNLMLIAKERKSNNVPHEK